MQRLLDDLVTPEVLRRAEGPHGQWPAALWQGLLDSGFLTAAAPEDLGGAGAPWGDLYPVLRAAGHSAAPVPLAETLLANALLGRCGLPARNAALSLAPRATLVASGTGSSTSISGTLMDVPFGRQVQGVLALLPAPQPGARPTLLLLDPAQARLSPRQNVAGEPRDTLVFERATPLAQAPLPEGLDSAALWLGGALLRCAQTAGALDKVLALSVQYATERSQFGKPIAAFQAIQHHLAQLAEHTGAAAVMAEAASAESPLDEAGGCLNPFVIATAKLCCAEAAGVSAALAHAVHGAIGFTHEHALQHLTRRLWAWRSEFGNAGHWQQRLGQAVCAAGSPALWPAVTAGRLALPALP
ncbi:MAG: acyl-CoA dehydrogenase [Burkholderiales bacterium PBB5]|nr:MAG: acyl-CoA dehydrogenase [Burkholderiales bacterium PBB5]